MPMTKRFEFRECQVQRARVMFVNGEWPGTIPLAAGDQEAALQSCPQEWDYLQHAGDDGWDLASAIGDVTNARILYLRRERD